MTTTGWVSVIVVILIVLGLGWWWYDSQMPVATPVTQTTTTSTTGTSTAPMTATVTYTDSGFSPASVTVAKGGTVTFVNNSSNPLWVASDPHPIHNAYDGTTLQQHCAAGYAGLPPFDECTSVNQGSSWSFTFNTTGNWGYHNHEAAENQGTVVVQ